MVGIYDLLARVLYDDERDVEYPPLKAMNDDAYANRIINSSAQPLIYVVTASSKLNSEMAINLRSMFTEHKIELLVPKDDGIDEIVKYIPDYKGDADPYNKYFYEKPYLETMFLVNELINLEYEKGENTGLIRIREQSGMMKDRYSSLTMGCYFVSQLERDLLSKPNSMIDAEKLFTIRKPQLIKGRW